MAKTNNPKGRDTSGRFSEGNKFGKGRPPRAVEQDYLSVLSEVMSLGDWRKIVIRAVEDAQKGNAKARDWVSRYALGEKPKTLTDLAVRDALGVTSASEIESRAKTVAQPHIDRLLDNRTPLQKSIDIEIDGNSSEFWGV